METTELGIGERVEQPGRTVAPRLELSASKPGLVTLCYTTTTCLHAEWRHSFLAHGRVSSVDLSYTQYLPLPAWGFFS
jgi:hypothetical protein